jgi:hypothetical protein
MSEKNNDSVGIINALNCTTPFRGVPLGSFFNNVDVGFKVNENYNQLKDKDSFQIHSPNKNPAKRSKVENILDFLESPNFFKFRLLVSSALPLIAGCSLVLSAISLSLAVTYTFVTLLLERNKYAELSALRIERVFLEKGINDQSSVDKDSIMQNVNEQDLQYYKPANTLTTLFNTVTLDALPIALSVMSGDVTKATYGVVCATLNAIKTHRSLNNEECNLQRLICYNTMLAKQLGITYSPGKTIEQLQKSYDPDSQPAKKTFRDDFAKVIKAGMRQSDHQELFSIEAIEAPVSINKKRV